MKKVILYALLFVLTATNFVSVLSSAEDSGLAAYWSFDGAGGGTVEDLSGNGSDLTVNDTENEITGGFSGEALDFTGGSSEYDDSKHMTVDAGKIGGALSGADGITVTAAVKKKVLASGTNFTVLRYYIDGVGVCMSVSLGAKNISIQARSASQSSAIQGLTTDEIVYPTRTNYQAVSGWMEIAAVFDYANKSIKVYADGILVGEKDGVEFSTDRSEFSKTSEGYFGVGSRTALVDEVKIYKYALSGEEIADRTRPALEYNFESADSGVIEDESAHRKNMQISGNYTVIDDAVEGASLKLEEKAYLQNDTIDGVLYGSKVVSATMWLKLTDGNLPGAAQSVIVDSNGGFNIKIETNGKVSYTMRSVSGSGFGNIETDKPVFTQGDKSWHHICVSMDYRDYTAKIYVDGSLGASKSIPASGVQFKIHYFGVGQGNNKDTVDLCSQTSVLMDSLKIYRRDLRISEIMSEASKIPFMKAEFSNPEAGTVKADCYISNQAGESFNDGIVIILARYDKSTPSRMLDAVFLRTDAFSAGARRNLEVKLEEIDDTSEYRYKLYAWKNFAGRKSLVKAIEYEVPN